MFFSGLDGQATSWFRKNSGNFVRTPIISHKVAVENHESQKNRIANKYVGTN